ncbi:hypothetical protein HAX54_023006, partial [Datura stramonium]|nr:hypothetical protein [Datura stramonium]
PGTRLQATSKNLCFIGALWVETGESPVWLRLRVHLPNFLRSANSLSTLHGSPPTYRR